MPVEKKYYAVEIENFRSILLRKNQSGLYQEMLTLFQVLEEESLPFEQKELLLEFTKQLYEQEISVERYTQSVYQIMNTSLIKEQPKTQSLTSTFCLTVSGVVMIAAVSFGCSLKQAALFAGLSVVALQMNANVSKQDRKNTLRAVVENIVAMASIAQQSIQISAEARVVTKTPSSLTLSRKPSTSWFQQLVENFDDEVPEHIIADQKRKEKAEKALRKFEKRTVETLEDLSSGIIYKPNLTGSSTEKELWGGVDNLCQSITGQRFFTSNVTDTKLEEKARRIFKKFF